MTDEEKEERENKCKRGETAFKNWLDGNGLGHVYINQDQEYFATLFKDAVKRPDFLVLMESIGILAIDVKNHRVKGQGYTIDKTEEIKSINFERVFRIPVWYAYFDEEKEDWYWISALKAFVVGKERTDEKGKTFLSIKLKEFVKIEENDDLGKLYAQRMEGLVLDSV